jgi:hypothetical protein
MKHEKNSDPFAGIQPIPFRSNTCWKESDFFSVFV